MWIQSKLSSLADGRVLKVVNISQDWMRRESERMGWDRGEGWLGYWVDSGVLRLPLSTRWQWSPVAMETLQSSFHRTHKLLVSSPTPPDITPFPSGPADRRMSVCCVGQQASKAGLCSAPKWQSRLGCGQGEWEEAMWRWARKIKALMSWCWDLLAGGSFRRDLWFNTRCEWYGDFQEVGMGRYTNSKQWARMV